MLRTGYIISSIRPVQNCRCFQQQQQSIIDATAANVIIVKYEMHRRTENQEPCAEAFHF